MPDLEITEKHISSFIADLENLKKHKDVTMEKVNADKDLLWILERGIFLLIQNLFDMLPILFPPISERAGIFIRISGIFLQNIKLFPKRTTSY